MGIGTTPNWSGSAATCSWQVILLDRRLRLPTAAQFRLRENNGLGYSSCEQRLWINQGRSADSRELLARCHGWFTEGLELPDLKNAEALLDLSLSDASSQ
jgi:hypothetical protein